MGLCEPSGGQEARSVRLRKFPGTDTESATNPFMKNNKTKDKHNGGHQSQRVHFELDYPAAESVFIAGTFNDWQPNVTPMIALGQGRWAKDLALPPGDYEYCLVVDGQWTPDPQVTETVPNPFGGVNSVRKVRNGD
jgi:1,4-alpha-glucan branching enzyme